MEIHRRRCDFKEATTMNEVSRETSELDKSRSEFVWTSVMLTNKRSKTAKRVCTTMIVEITGNFFSSTGLNLTSSSSGG